MSLKFEKCRSVDFRYHAVPLNYTGVTHPSNKQRELVLLDWYPKGTENKPQGGTFLCAWKNHNTGKVGRQFLCKEVLKDNKRYFEFKDKLYDISTKNGWVW